MVGESNGDSWIVRAPTIRRASVEFGTEPVQIDIPTLYRRIKTFHTPMMKYHFLPVVCLAATACLPLPLTAQKVISYTGEAGTDIFSDTGNWSDQTVPGPADTALFSQSGEYLLTLKADASIAMIRMQEGDEQAGANSLTLRLDGKKLTMLAAPSEKSSEMAIVLSASAQAPRTLIFEGGFLEFTNFWQATYRGEQPTVLIFDKGISVDCPGMGYTGAYGQGETYLIGGSKWISNGRGWAGVLGHTEGSSGLLEISGTGSSFSAKTELGTSPLDVRTFYVSTKGNGTLRVLDGASFVCDVVNQGNGVMDAEAFSLVVVDGTNSVFAADHLNVGGGSTHIVNPAQPAGNALFSISNGAVAKVGALKVFSRENSDGIPAAHGRVLIDGGTFDVGVETPEPLAEFAPNSTLEFRIRNAKGAAPLRSETELKIEGVRLVVTLDPAFRADVGDKISLVACQNINGKFKDLAEGSTIQADSYSFALSYNLDGKDVIGLKVTKTAK